MLKFLQDDCVFYTQTAKTRHTCFSIADLQIGLSRPSPTQFIVEGYNEKPSFIWSFAWL